MKHAGIPYFTPSMCEPALLESMFVGKDRKRLLNRLVDLVRDSTTGDNRYYALILGPRGMGKTHLMSLLYYRVRERLVAGPELKIAWLHEDPWAISSYAGLLKAVLNQLHEQYTIPGWVENVTAIEDLEAITHKEHAFEQMLINFIASGVLLLIAENLDEIFHALGDLGQKKFRAFLEAKGITTVVATSTTLIHDFRDRDRPFFGLFNKEFLAPLTYDDCVEALLQLSKYMGNDDLVAVLESPQGRGRVRAIHHLAGGNPRIYAIFYQFLSRESLNQLAEPFMELVNELTPYYQSRMQTLSPRQRTLVEIIRKNESPVALQEIAKLSYETVLDCLQDLKTLGELGYLESQQIGGDSLYELREPLMRICLSVKELRGQPLRLFVDFLRIWFSPSELQDLGRGLPAQSVDYELYKSAIEESRRDYNKIIEFQHTKIMEDLQENRAEVALVRLKRLCEKAPNDYWAWSQSRELLVKAERYDELTALALERTKLFPESGPAWNDLSYASSFTNDFESALSASERATQFSPEEPVIWQNHLNNLSSLGLEDAVTKVALQVLKLPKKVDSAPYWSLNAHSLQLLGDNLEAATAWMKSIALAGDDIYKWRALHVALERAGALKGQVALASFVARRFSTNATAWRDYATALIGSGDTVLALLMHEKAIRLAPNDETLQAEHIAYLINCNRFEDIERNLTGWEARAKSTDDTSVLLYMTYYKVAAHNLSEAADYLRRFVLLSRSQKSLGQHMGPVRNVNWINSRQGFVDHLTLWTHTFSELGMIEALGPALLKGTLWLAATQTAAVLQTWIEICKEQLAGIVDLQIALRLMQALTGPALSNPELLLGLPLEQRKLLEPELDKLERKAGGPSYRLDLELERFLQIEEDRLAETEHASVNAFVPDWATAVFGQTLDFSEEQVSSFLELYDEGMSACPEPRRLLNRTYTALTKDSASILLKMICASRIGAATLRFKDSLKVIRIDRREYSVGSGNLFQVIVNVGRQGVFDLWADDKQVIILDGTSGPMYQLVRKGAIVINEQTALDYLALFSSTLRGDGGRFEIVLEDTELYQSLLAVGLSKEDLAISSRSLDQTSLRLLPLVYTDALFRSQFTVASDGKVEMLGEVELKAELDVLQEDFEGPLRFIKST